MLHKIGFFKKLNFYSMLFSVMMMVWYALSSEYSAGFFLLATIASWSTIYMCYVLELIKPKDNMKYSAFWRIISYYSWILKAVFEASVDVTRRVWSGHGSANSGFCRIAIPETSDVGMVAFANSITLTPGTISVYIDDQFVIVHTMDKTLEHALRNENEKIIKKVNVLVGYQSTGNVAIKI